MAEIVLDLIGLHCPLPALKTRKRLKETAAGNTLVVTCSDPLAEIDLPNLVRETGDTLVAHRKFFCETGALRLEFHILKA